MQPHGGARRIEFDPFEHFMQRLPGFVSAGAFFVFGVGERGEQAAQQRAHLVDGDGAGRGRHALSAAQRAQLVDELDALVLEVLHAAQDGRGQRPG